VEAEAVSAPSRRETLREDVRQMLGFNPHASVLHLQAHKALPVLCQTDP
jgi:hypothetical protein